MSRKIYWTFLAGFIFGLVGAWIFFSSNSDSRATQVRQGGFTYINPLLECEVGEELISKELRPFKGIVQEKVDQILEEGKASHISIYFRDLNNGPWIGINEREEFILASLVKVPVMISYFREAEEDPSILAKSILFSGSLNPNVPYFKPASTLETGKSYTVMELIERMIRYSDNDAYDLLVLNLKGNQINETFNSIGATLPPDRIRLTVKAYASFFRILFNSSYLNQDHSEQALSILAKTQFDQGIRAGVPGNTMVAHKFGEKWNPSESNEKQLHDCGIVYFPNHPYLLCVMTRGESFDTLASVIKDLSALVYHEVNEQF